MSTAGPSRALTKVGFAPTYAAARESFLAACAESKGAHIAHRHAGRGPDGGALFLDEVRFGPHDAARVLFVFSGTHGIEGFCGSAIQQFLLRDGVVSRLPRAVALVLVHAVNPWGFAWHRRVNEDNADLNRNFLDHDAPHPSNPDYDALYDALNPQSFDEATIAAAQDRLRRFQTEAGFAAGYRAMSGGQYAHPRGIQYGGREAAWSNRTLREVWARHGAEVELAVGIDLHSGLGPNGVGLLMQTAPEASVAARLAHAWWPDVLRFEPAQGTDAALASGLLGPAFVAALPHAASVGVVLEFGTHPLEQVAVAVQADNWLEFNGRRDSEAGQGIARQMREAFLIEDDEWKEKVFMRAKEVVDRTLQGMAEFAPGVGA
jgi:hypothetical protein